MTTRIRNGVNIKKVIKGKLPAHLNSKKIKNIDTISSCSNSRVESTVSTRD